jgi:hypothetical protein
MARKKWIAFSVDRGSLAAEDAAGAGGKPRLSCCGVPLWLKLPAHAPPGPLFFMPSRLMIERH